MKNWVVLIFVWSSALSVKAQKTAVHEFSANAEMYSAHSFLGTKSSPNFLVSYTSRNKLSANLMMLKYSTDGANWKRKRPLKFNFALMTGSYALQNLRFENQAYRNIYEANVGFKLRKNGLLEMGVLPSHIGLETATGMESWAATRSIVADNSPYYESGIRYSTTFMSNKIKANLNVLNGWQNITPRRFNQVGIGHQIQYLGKRLTLNSSSYFGKFNQQNRLFHNAYAQWQINLKWGIVLGLDQAIQWSKRDSIKRKNFQYYAPLVLLQYSINDKWKLCGRYELFKDPHILLNESSLKSVVGYSFNADYRYSANFWFRAECRLFQEHFSSKIQTGYATIAVCARI